MTVDRASAPAAPGRLGEPIAGDALLKYLDALHDWRGLRKQELDRLDGRRAPVEQCRRVHRRPQPGDGDVAVGHRPARATHEDLGLRAGRPQSQGGHVPADLEHRRRHRHRGLSLVESCRLSDALTASLRARLAFDPAAADVAARIADTRASLQRSIELAATPKTPKPPSLPNLAQLTTRLDGLADRASRGADVTGPLIVLEAEAARAERDLIVTSAAHRTLGRDYRAALEQRNRLEQQEGELRDLVARATETITPVPRFAVPDVERLGRVPQERAALEAYLARLDAVERALQFARSAYTAPLAELDELRGRLQAYHAKAAAIGRADAPAVATAYDQAEAALGARPCPLPQARELVAAYQRSLTTTPAPGGPA